MSLQRTLRTRKTCINEFKRDYQPRSNLVKDETGDLLADFNNVVNRSKSYFSQSLNVHNVRDVRQIEIHTAEPLVPGPSHLEVTIATATIKFQQNRFKQEGKH
jgi:hypothetical protein